MKERVKSYYQSTDSTPYNKYKRKLNYLRLFPTTEETGYLDEDASSSEYSNTSFLSVFSPVEYKINTSPLEVQEEIEDVQEEQDNDEIQDQSTASYQNTTPRRRYPSTWVVDDVISGLIHIMDSDPKLRGKFRITSLYRAGATTKSGRPSFHGSGKAVDIVPVQGTFDTLEADMMANRELVMYMIQNKIGILDEYTPNGHQARTGATGNHMHIGPDQLALSDFKKLLKKYEINIET